MITSDQVTTYRRHCRYCREPIVMVRERGRWRALNAQGSYHRCGTGPVVHRPFRRAKRHRFRITVRGVGVLLAVAASALALLSK